MSRSPLVPLAVALAARIVPAIAGYEHYGDAPVRIEIAERWAAHPHLWHGFLETYQYGPLHLTLIGALVRLLGDRVVAARALSLGCGLAGVWLLGAIARRERGEEAAFWAALALALSPLHIQASATGASEAVFLALFLAALWLTLEERAFAAALVLGAAGLVRYDGWMYVPLFAGLLALRTRDGFRAAGFAAIALAPAFFWMWVNARYAGDALLPIRHIDRDHLALARMALSWFGQARYRLYGLVYWPLAVCLVATPALGLASLWGSARCLWRRAAGWELVTIAWLPALYFTFRTAVLADFRPMARFAMVASALSLVFASDALARLRRPARAFALALGVATPLALAAVSWNRTGSLAEWARPLSPIGSLPPGIAEAAAWLKHDTTPGDTVLLDGVWDYLDIPLAFAAGLPDAQWIRAAWVEDFEQRLLRRTPTRAVLIYQGKLGDFRKDRFDFRGLSFCLAERFTYASVYRRCAS
ncbi:MAG TPA: glycosyltransferase family 39 protein [Myxococcales bacterium]|nr:glycosyltransferase family 39 protein [Myxococcales bacterium]